MFRNNQIWSALSAAALSSWKGGEHGGGWKRTAEDFAGRVFPGSDGHVRRFADSLSGPRAQATYRRVQDFARREPVWFAFGAFAAGFAAVRFFKSRPDTYGSGRYQ